MTKDELLLAPALQHAEWLRKRDVSSEELTRLYLDRIHELDARVGAFVAVFEKQAMRAAQTADKELAVRRSDAPLFLGVPTAIKDLHPTKEAWTHFGSRAFMAPPHDSITAVALRRAGFVFLGKTASPEFGALPITEPDGQPPTRNPWDLQRTAGGSSGGAAAAVAAGMVPIAHGSDGGGSIRIPSALCHLFGFKPTRWLLPNAYGKRDPSVLYTCGPIARTVSDAAAMLDALMRSNAQRGLRFSIDPVLPRLSEVPRRGLRVRMIVSSNLATPSPAHLARVRSVGTLLEKLGHVVEEAAFPDVNLEDFIPIWGRVLREMPAWLPWRMQNATQWLRAEAKRTRPARIHELLMGLTQLIERTLEGADLILSPTVPVAPLPIGALTGLGGKEAFYKASVLGVFTAPFNLTGQPAASVPAGFSDDGLPIGVQVAARQREDVLVLQICKQIEDEMPWAGHWPKLSGLVS